MTSLHGAIIHIPSPHSNRPLHPPPPPHLQTAASSRPLLHPSSTSTNHPLCYASLLSLAALRTRRNPPCPNRSKENARGRVWVGGGVRWGGGGGCKHEHEGYCSKHAEVHCRPRAAAAALSSLLIGRVAGVESVVCSQPLQHQLHVRRCGKVVHNVDAFVGEAGGARLWGGGEELGPRRQ